MNKSEWELNLQILEDLMPMAVLNWMILLVASEKLPHNFFNLKGDFV